MSISREQYKDLLSRQDCGKQLKKQPLRATEGGVTGKTTTPLSLTFNFKLLSKDNEKVFNRAGRPFLSNKYRQFELLIKCEARKQYKGEPFTGRLNVTIEAYFKNKVHSDCLNLPKSAMDALQGIAFVNDRQIMIGHIYVFESSPIESFIVRVSKI